MTVKAKATKRLSRLSFSFRIGSPSAPGGIRTRAARLKRPPL